MLKLLSAAVCAALIAAIPQTATAKGIYRIYGGQPFDVPEADLRIELLEITDQRCPSTVACVWEGVKRAQLLVSQGTASKIVVLCNACDDGDGVADVFGHRLEFEDLWPEINMIEALGRPAVVTDYAVSVILDGQ